MAGGATLLVTPRGHVEFSRLRGLSPSGRCSPFSTDADGVVWAEGCGLVLLKRLADARATATGSSPSSRGRPSTRTAAARPERPERPGAGTVVRAALDAAGLRPDDLDHVERTARAPARGPIEGRALAAVFGPGRPADRPLGVGPSSPRSVTPRPRRASAVSSRRSWPSATNCSPPRCTPAPRPSTWTGRAAACGCTAPPGHGRGAATGCGGPG
ncbi:beta-ketoacyl synthase N-terminal-like domain-containing protein [Streptomyces mirabilis]|nr:beta-ketoacyl synthase N-terminal-like domain-containing protein [Streptomyces mirabilis]